MSTLAWTEDSLDDFARGALLTCLAVIHHGRGRGAWSDIETVPAWRKAVDETMAKMQESLHALWEQREAAAEVVLSDALSPWMLEAAADLLDRLYPDALGSFMPVVVEG